MPEAKTTLFAKYRHQISGLCMILHLKGAQIHLAQEFLPPSDRVKIYSPKIPNIFTVLYYLFIHLRKTSTVSCSNCSIRPNLQVIAKFHSIRGRSFIPHGLYSLPTALNLLRLSLILLPQLYLPPRKAYFILPIPDPRVFIVVDGHKSS